MTSEIRTNSLKSRAGLSTVTLTDSGPMFSGITTFVDNSGFNIGTGSSIFSPATNTLTLGTNSNERLLIESGGDVSIGGMDANTFTGYRTFTIGGSGASDGAGIDLERSDGNIYGRFFADTNGVQIQSPQSGDYIRFETAGANERLRITDDGTFGVNLTTPKTTKGIHISKGTGNGGIGNSYSLANEYLHFGYSEHNASGDMGLFTMGFGYVAGGTPATNSPAYFGYNETSTSGYTNGALVFATRNVTTNTAPTERLRIDTSGRLLLNTTTTYASNQMMIVKGASPSAGGNRPYDGQLAIEGSETTGAINTGGVLAFIGHDGGTARGFGSIRNLKEDGTSGNYGTYMSFETRANGSAPAEKLRIDSTGRLLIGVDAATNNDSYVQAFKSTGNDATITVGNVATSASGLCRYDFAPSNKVVGSRIECHASEDFSTSANRTADLVFITRKDGTLSEKLRIKSDGLVKINQPAAITDGSFFSTITITSPNGIFQGLRFDRGSTAKWRIGMQNDDTFQIANLFQNGSVSANDNTLRITDNNNISMVGKLGIQVTSPSHELDLGGVATNQDDGSEYTLRIRSNDGKTAIRIGSGGGGSRVALMRFDGDSNPGSGVGCSGDTDKSAYGGTLVYHGDRSGNENSFAIYMDQGANANQIEAFNIRQNGDYMHGGSSYSDRDQKQNITAISGTALDKITQLSPKTWNWKPEYHDIPTDRIFAGFIAQEVQPHIPSLVTGTDGQGDMALDYQGLLAWTIKAVTELNSKVDTLEQENIALGARVKDLESLQNYYPNGN